MINFISNKHGIGLCCFLFISQVFAETSTSLSTLSVIQHTVKVAPQCVHYRVIGTCYWLQCDGVCRVTPTLKVDHYLPDAVVTVYQGHQHNPWDYANRVVDNISYPIGEAQMNTEIGYGNESANSSHDQDTHFKEVDVIGNPALSVFAYLKQVFIQSNAKPFKPYYVSLADAYSWRTPRIEMMRYPQHLLPGIHIVGTLANNWGSIYPRTGFLMQPQDAKGAAVIAQRAVDIATRTHQLHVYQVLPSGSCGANCRVKDTQENHPDTQWQMIYPIAETQCSAFGENDLANQPWGSEAAKKTQGNYAWVLWRHYVGCIQGDGKYLNSIDIKGGE